MRLPRKRSATDRLRRMRLVRAIELLIVRGSARRIGRFWPVVENWLPSFFLNVDAESWLPGFSWFRSQKLGSHPYIRGRKKSRPLDTAYNIATEFLPTKNQRLTRKLGSKNLATQYGYRVFRGCTDPLFANSTEVSAPRCSRNYPTRP